MTNVRATVRSSEVRWLALIVAVAAAALASSPRLGAYSTHNNTLTLETGSNRTPSHGTVNPGHLWLSFRGAHGVFDSSTNGRVTSGAIFHDGCADGQCNGAFPAQDTDWAIDIVAPNSPTAHTDIRVSVRYGGVGAHGSPPLDLNHDIWIYLKLKDQGGSAVGCKWQRWGVYVTYYVDYGSTSGPKSGLPIADFWIMHGDEEYWQHTTIGDVVGWNSVSENPDGPEQIFEIVNVKLGEVYNDGNPGCANSGPHTHIEMRSNHLYGKIHEWHSNYFEPQSSCDGYVPHVDDSVNSHCSPSGYPAGGGPYTQVAFDSIISSGGTKRTGLFRGEFTGLLPPEQPILLKPLIRCGSHSRPSITAR